MPAKAITSTFFVSDQINPQDVIALSQHGFKSIICNRPDNEGADQPNFPEIVAAAKAAGIETAYLPVVVGNVTDSDVQTFGTLLDQLPKPVLAYCRSGTRAATLWSLSEGKRGRPLADIIAATKTAGYDMTGIVQRLGQ